MENNIKTIEAERLDLKIKHKNFLKDQEFYDDLDIGTKRFYEEMLDRPNLDPRIRDNYLQNLELIEKIQNTRINIVDEQQLEYSKKLKELDKLEEESQKDENEKVDL